MIPPGKSAAPQERRGPDRFELFCLLGVIALGAVLRLRGLGDHSLWYDEVITMATAQSPWRDFFTMVRVEFLCPPLDYIFMRPFVAWGRSDALARAWSATASVLCIPAIYLWARSVAKAKGTALIAAALLAASAFAVDYGQEARMYSSFLLITILSFHALARLHARPTRARACVYGLAAAALLLTHYFGIWVLALQAPWLLLELKRTQGWAKALGLACLGWALGAALFSLWMPSFLAQLAGSQGGTVPWGMPFTGHSFSSLLVLYCSGRNTPWVFGAAFLWAAILAHRRGDRGMQALAWIALGCLVLPLAASQFKPNVAPRYLIFFLAPFYVVVAEGIARVAERFRYGLPVALCALLAGQVPAVLRDHSMGINAWKPRWHEAADFINADQGRLPVAVEEWTDSIVLGYYVRPLENHFWPQLSAPPPPAHFRVVVVDEALVRAIEAGSWQGWFVLHFGANREAAQDALVARIRAVAGAPRLHLDSPNESNGVDVYFCGKGRAS